MWGGRILRSRAALALTALAVLAAAPAASGHSTAAVAASAPASCAGKADGSFDPPIVVTGEFDTSVEGGYVLLPFTVPAGTTAVRVKYCHDQPDAPTSSQIKHVLDLGLYEARGLDGFFDGEEFRGWGGSSHPDVTVSPNGFSSEATYVARPREHVHGRTTRGFRPGPIPPGEWAVELGAAAIASQLEGDSDGKVAWRVEIALSTSGSWADDPYQPAAYDSAPASSQPGWYAGDFHVHAEHSSLGDATMRETFDFAFAPLARDCPGCPESETGAGLDFITLSDYVTDSAWGEVGRYQADHPGKQIVRSSEIITYRGHANNHASSTYVDYRTGPVYELRHDGTLELKRGPRPASALFEGIRGGDGFTQINHPTIFPSEVPGFDFLCRGCPWDYTDAETDFSQVDAIEVATGPAGLQEDPEPGPNPFTPLALRFWEDAIDAGGANSNKIAAVGSSDSHKAGCRNPGQPYSPCDPVTQVPIGTATTVVYADELSEKGIQRAVEARHTYVKVFGNDGPDLRLEATVPGSSEPPAIMGDTVHAANANFTARVLGAGPSAARPGDYELFVFKDGLPILAAPVVGDDFTLPFTSVGPGRYRLQVQRSTAIEAVSSPIWLEPPFTGYPRPQGAGVLRVPLAIAYETCGDDEEPNRTHGPALELPSCNPATPASDHLTVGTPDSNGKPAAGTSSLSARVVPGDSTTPADEADVELTVAATDVRRASDLSDYTGELLASTDVRLTDRSSAGAPPVTPYSEPATVSDFPFTAPVPCSETASAEIGASCSLETTVDALVPGAITEGTRAIWELGSFELRDGGADGIASTADNTPFQRQGAFVP